MEELKTGKRVAGLKQSKRAIEEGRALQAYVAMDAQERVVKPFIELLSEKQVPYVTVETMEALGKAAGIDVKTAVAVLLKP